MSISLIAAVDEQFGLGKDNQLLCYLPADLQHFKQLTLGKPVIMGRKTFLSIGKPLPGRQNIVLSTHCESIQGVETAHCLQEALLLADKAKEIMVIGGAEVFSQALPLASTIYLTLIHHQFSADVFFPHFDKALWRCVSVQTRPSDEKNRYDMTFFHYIRALGEEKKLG